MLGSFFYEDMQKILIKKMHQPFNLFSLCMCKPIYFDFFFLNKLVKSWCFSTNCSKIKRKTKAHEQRFSVAERKKANYVAL